MVGDGPLGPQLEELAAAEGVADRVTFTGAVDERRARRSLRRRARAIVFPPFDEDYGYVTLEAFLARKPVITTTDAGGPLGVRRATRSPDCVAAPTPEAVGGAIAQARRRPAPRRAAPRRRRPRARRSITWDGVVERLMADG